MRFQHTLRVLAVFSVPVTHFHAVCATATATPTLTPTPAPVSVNFGTDFFGTDGFWSAAQIRVGTPEQYLWAYPSTISSETWVIGPDGCAGAAVCQAERGGLFYANQSTTYNELGDYQLGYNPLGLATGSGDYGLDTISISDSVSTPSQVIATVTSLDTWLGEFGLGVKETRFEGTTNYLSFISTLVQNESVIPSHSYGYTAGAHYALKSIPGSLTLGGVDTTRFTPNDISFTLNPNYYPEVAIQTVTVSSSQSQGLVALPPNWNANPLRVMQPSMAALFTVDTSTPFLWMPPAVCDSFADALNLTYNSDLDLYMFSNVSSPQVLSDWGLSFTFTLANSVDSTSSAQLVISYDAFDLQLSYGFPNLDITDGSSAVSYFPLRRANSSTQYTIGRAFLQETYLVVDYERNNFSLYPAIFPDVSAITPRIVPITRPNNSQWPGPQTQTQSQSTSSLSTAAKAGIGIGVTLSVFAVLAVVLFVVRRKRKLAVDDEKTGNQRKWTLRSAFKKPSSPDVVVSELSGDRRHPRELLVDSSNTRYELAGQVPFEMPAEEVPEAYLASRHGLNVVSNEATNNTGDSQLTRGNQSSIRKDYNIRAKVTKRSTSPAPPYSPSENPNRHESSEGVSAFDSRGSSGFGSHSSLSVGVSPIVRQVPGSRSEGSESPISPTQPVSQSLSVSRVVSATNHGEHTSMSALRQSRVTRTGSRNSRFREQGLVEDDESDHVSEGQEASAQTRSRFSWEE